MGEEVEGLEHHADVRARLGELGSLGRELLALDRDRPRGDGLESVDRPAQGRLARTGGSDDDDDLALVDVEVDVLQRMEVSVVLLDVRHRDQRL